VVLLVVGLVGALTRPRGLPAWAMPATAAAIALATGVVDVAEVRAAWRPLVAPLAFVAVAVPLAASLDAFVRPEDAAEVCATIALIFRDHGPREARSRARLAFLLQERGAAWMREELEKRLGHALPPAGADARSGRVTDHVGVFRQKQEGHPA